MENPNDVVIEIRGGVVVEVYSARTDMRVILVDWDDIAETGERKGAVYPHVPIKALPEDTLEACTAAA